MKSSIGVTHSEHKQMKTAAFFDMDGTLLRGESQFSFLLWCLRRGIAPRMRALPVVVQYASYLAGLSDDASELRKAGFDLLRGISVENLEQASTRFFHDNLIQRFRNQATALIEAHRQQKHLIVLVTSACKPVALPVASRLNCDAIIATHLLTSGDHYTGERVLPEPYAEGKTKLVEIFCQENSINPKDCFVYADHHTDVALLEFVGNPVPTNPNKKLRRFAKRNSWPVLDLDATANASDCKT
jgi:putative phosphoserine phosphatase / 1-acylglycerol-3-phosphate O-acyltransferase